MPEPTFPSSEYFGGIVSVVTVKVVSVPSKAIATGRHQERSCVDQSQ